MTKTLQILSELRTWPGRRWLIAGLVAVATILVVALPTALIPNPIFGREIPPTAWAWPVLIINAILAGLVTATYVARKDVEVPNDKGGKLGSAGAFVTFFAVGCPVCNKLVLLALGYTGALQFFGPFQPFLAAGAIGLLLWAFASRVLKENSCPLPVSV